MDDVEKVWRGVLDSLRYFPSEKTRDTMMDATRRQYDENLISNLLAYYTDSHNPHGFGTLIASALWHLHAPDKQCEFGNTTVKREYSTKEGNRIDLVIETDADVVIAIENKIFSGLNNPLDEYRQSLHDSYPKKELVCFVLAPDLRSLGSGCEEWQAITYHSLWKEVRALLGTYISTTNLYWLSGLITLIEHTDNINNMEEDLTLNSGEKYMLNKCSDIKKAVESFQALQRKIADFMEPRYKKIVDEIKRGKVQDERAVPECWRWGKNSPYGGLQVFEFKKIDCAIDFGITDLGIVFCFFARKTSGDSFYRKVCNQLSDCEGAEKFKEMNKGYYLLQEEIDETILTKEGMERLVSRAVELVKTVQEAIMSLPMDEQEREVGQSAPSAQ